MFHCLFTAWSADHPVIPMLQFELGEALLAQVHNATIVLISMPSWESAIFPDLRNSQRCWNWFFKCLERHTGITEFNEIESRSEIYDARRDQEVPIQDRHGKELASSSPWQSQRVQLRFVAKSTFVCCANKLTKLRCKPGAMVTSVPWSE